MPDVKLRIPHQPPFVMVDRILSANAEECTSEYRVSDTDLLCADGTATEGLIVENIAQTLAAGLAFRASEPSAPAQGYISAIRSLRIHRLPEPGDLLRTEARVVNRLPGNLLVQGIVHLDEERLAEAELFIHLPEPAHER